MALPLKCHAAVSASGLARLFGGLALAVLVGPAATVAAEPGGQTERQAEVAQRGTQLMPFSLAATVHVFTPDDSGGTQQVLTRAPGDAAQASMIRRHLQELRAQFLRGDFSAPSRIHGDDMPGLQALKAAAPGQIAIDYHEVENGAELVYRSSDAALVDALHRWFAAQLADHGQDAMEGHMHHHHQHMPAPEPEPAEGAAR